MADLYRFAAFISYSNHDSVFARRLHKALERYRIPRALGVFDLAGKPNRVAPMFLDQHELAAGHLDDNIKAALRASSAIIVICSPNGARSAWVEKEVQYFRSLGREGRIFGIITSGEPNAAPSDAVAECLPPSLRVLSNGDEVLAGDARPGRGGFRSAWLKLVAGLIGISLGQLIDRDRKARRLKRTVVACCATLAFAVVGCGYAVMASVQNAERWRLASAQLASTGHPYDAVRFAIAGVAGATDLRRVFDATMAGQALRDTGFGQRALLLLQGQYIADKSLLFGSGKRLLTISSEHYGRLWDIDRGIRLVDLGKISEWVVSDDETRLVVKSDHDQLVIYDAQSGSQIAQLSGPNSAPEFQFSKKFKFIVTRSSQRQCVLWDATDGRLVSALTPPRGCNAIGGLKDAPLVNIRRPDRTGFIATGAGKVVGNLPFCEYCAISKNGKVAYAFRDNIGSFVEAGTARVISRVRLSGGLAEIEFDDTGDRVAILDQSGLLTLWDTRRGKQVREIGPTDSKYWHVSASHKHVFVTPDDDSAEVWRMQDGVKLISFPPGAGRGLWSSKDGSLIASTGKRGAIYDGVGGVLLSSLPPEGRKIQSITLSDDDRRAVVSSDGAPGYIWDVQGKRKVSEFRDQDEDLGDQGVFSGDSRRYATGGVGGQSNLWDAVTGTYLARLAGEEGATTLQLSRDGMRAVTTTSYSEAAVWDLSNPPGDLDQTSLRARACVLNYQAIGTFSAAERGAHGLSGRPWHPCDWRGLQSIEGWAQLARRWAYRLGLDHDYRCADVTAGGRQTASSLATCYQSTDSNQTASPRLSSMVQLKSDDGSPIVWFERLW